jgi:hypothetical protein
LTVPVERRGDGQGDCLIVPTLGGVAGGAGLGRASRHPWKCRLGDMSGGICVVVDGGLLEDILEVAEGLDDGFVHVGGQLIV